MPVMGAACYAGIIQVGDVAAIASKVNRGLAADVSEGTIATELDAAAVTFVLSSRISGNAPAGELARWCRGVQTRAAALLAAFEMENAGDWYPDHAAHALLLQDGARRAEALPGDPDAVLDDALAQVRFLARRARLAAEGYEAHRGSPRKAPIGEIVFVRHLAQIFEHTFGIAAGVGSAPGAGAQPDGPCIRFVVAVAKIIARWLPDADPRRDRALLASLGRLQRPVSVRDRLRDISDDGELPRKR